MYLVADMRFPRGKRRDFEALERRRLQAADLLQQGLSQSEVARRVGVHRQAVSQWAEALRERGCKGLSKARVGRPLKLRAEDLRRIVRGLKRGPEVLGYGTSLWTSARVAHLIEEECRIRYAIGHAWRILRQLGWSSKRPVGRARNGMRRRSARGSASAGRRSKTLKRAADDRLHRAKRVERAPTS